MYVVSGPPGSGKSTVAALLAEDGDSSALVDGDAFFGFLRRGFVEPWRPAAHEQNAAVLEASAAATGRLARDGRTVVHDGVVGPWFLERFAAACAVADLHYVVLLPPLAVLLDRVTTRRDHPFDDVEAARHMHAAFVAAAPDPRHVIAGEDGPGATADAVRRAAAAGRLRVT